jgi:tetratricopeptide (TPR) repeat protein
MLVTLPFVLLLLDYWPLQRVPDYKLRWSDWSPLLWEKWPFFALSAGSCVVTFIAQKHGEAVAPLEAYPLSVRICNSVVAYARYLLKTIYPADLAAIYPLSRQIPWGQVAGAVVVLTVISWGVWRMRVSKPYLLTGWLWYLGMLVPVIGLVQVGPQALADRYSYLPLIGVFIAVTFGIRDLVIRLQVKPVLPIAVAVLTLGGCLGATAWQLRFWQSSKTLFERALAVTRNNPTAENNLGFVLSQTGHPQEALEHFEKALQLDPDDALVHDNLALALQTLGRSREAMEHFQVASRLAPDNAKIQDNWAVALLQTGRFPEAMEHFEEALRLNPQDAQAHNNLGILLDKTGHPHAALEHFRKALQLQPNFPRAYYNLALTLSRLGQFPEAIENFERALQLQPNFPIAFNSLGRVLFADGQTDEAIAQFRTALRLRPDFVQARNNLGDALLRSGYAHFQKGRIPEAIPQLQEGLQIRPDDVMGHNYLGFALLSQGQAGPAAANFQMVLKLQPDNLDAHKYLAWILATCPDASLRNGRQAMELAEQANRLSGTNNPAILATLAAAQAEIGQFAAAVGTARKALELASSRTNTAVVNALRKQFDCYKRNVPFRDGSLTNTQPAT